MQIKDRFTGKVLHDSGCADLRGADLRGADLRDADLRGADLRDADLRGADLRDANLRDADLRDADLRDANLLGANLRGEKLKSNPVFFYGLTWFITVTNEFLTIGCQRHSHSDWDGFDDAKIESMHACAIEFWRKWKPSLMLMCAEQSSL